MVFISQHLELCTGHVAGQNHLFIRNVNFRSQFKLKAGEEKEIFQFLLLICDICNEAWFQAPYAVTAPATDPSLLRQAAEYRTKGNTHATVTAFNCHLWYLGEITIGLACFDPQIDFSKQQAIVSNMQRLQAGLDHPSTTKT